ncbi:MAG: hypothetical protein HY423_11300 [Candidatus Lambdaproteobacteria bacterium]|nr:hypothetical protein [Candidatus Lambdaproteobacteria bacterium]
MADETFLLFCEYYLGLTPEGEFRFTNANKMARRLNCTPADLFATLKRHRLHPDTVLNTDFPLARYQVDIQLAAGTVASERLLEMARAAYEAYLGAVGTPRDWLREIEQEREADRERERERRRREPPPI